MGYLTLHKISIVNKYNCEENLERLWQVIKNISGYDFNIYNKYLIDNNWNEGECTKWYSFHSDIFKI